MAAPTYTWEFERDLWGNRVPIVTTLKASANLETKIGTLLVMASGKVDEATANVVAVIGLALEATSAALAEDAPIKVALLAPGMEIVGTADADASALTGFNPGTVDLNADGSLDVADAANGSLAVHRVENAGLKVHCVVTKFAMQP